MGVWVVGGGRSAHPSGYQVLPGRGSLLSVPSLCYGNDHFVNAEHVRMS